MQDNQKFIQVVTDDGTRHQIRVAGTISNPYFFGTDVCKIINIKNHKKAFFDNVDNTHKIELKQLLVQITEASTELVTLKLGSFDLEKLSYHDGRAVVLSEPGLHQLLNGTRLQKHRKSIESAVQRWTWTTRYASGAGLVDLLSFIRGSNLVTDLTSDWFKDLWYPLSTANPPHVGGVGRVNNRPVIVTQNLLDWMGFQGRDLSDKQEKFSRVLKRNGIPYEEIGCSHPLAIEYPCVQTEMMLIPKQVEQKKWICLNVRDFKKAVMRLHTENGDSVRDYYLNLEEAVVSYGEYTARFMIEKAEFERRLKNEELLEAMNKLAIKDKALEEAENAGVKTRSMLEHERKTREEAEKQQKIAELRAVTLTRLNVAFQERAKTQIFYIATSKVMAKDNEFKIGGVENHSLLKRRLSMYNTGNSGVHQELTMFFVFFVEVSNYKQMEMRTKELIHPFRSKRNANSENFNLHFNILKLLVEMVAENYNEEIEKLNGFVQALLETHTDLYVDPVDINAIDPDCVPDRLDVHLTVTRRGFGTANVQKAKITELNDTQLKEVVSKVIETLETPLGSVVKRKDIEKVLSDSFVIQSNLRRIWDVSKVLIEENGKTPKY